MTYCCQECSREFKTFTAAMKALDNGCPTCGSYDIDKAPINDDQSSENLLRRQKLSEDIRKALEIIGKLPRVPDMTIMGRYGLWQKIDSQWQPTGTSGYQSEADAQQRVDLLNKDDPDMWRVRERWPIK